MQFARLRIHATRDARAFCSPVCHGFCVGLLFVDIHGIADNNPWIFRANLGRQKFFSLRVVGAPSRALEHSDSTVWNWARNSALPLLGANTYFVFSGLGSRDHDLPGNAH